LNDLANEAILIYKNSYVNYLSWRYQNENFLSIGKFRKISVSRI
jgi:hypothetical protein